MVEQWNGGAAIHPNGYSSKWLFIKTAIHRNGYSSKRLFIKMAIHQNGYSSKQLFIETAIHQNRFSPKWLFTGPTCKWLIHRIVKHVGSGNCQSLFTFWSVHQMHNNGTSKICPSMQIFRGIPNLQSTLLHCSAHWKIPHIHRNMKMSFNVETSGGQNFNLYLYAVYFFNSRLN